MIKERIQDGIELLDQQTPNWCEKIDLKTLHLDSSYFCVLGQVYGGYSSGLNILEIDEGWEYGFDIKNGGSYRNLNKEWVKAIKEHCSTKWG